MSNTKQQIIKSLLDIDFYKLTMHQIIMHKFPDAIDTEFKFKCRNKTADGVKVDFSNIIDELNHQLDLLCELKLKEDEIDWMRNNGSFKEDYIERMKDFKLDRNKISAKINPDGSLEIKALGFWFVVALFEIYVLAIVNELYFKNNANKDNGSVYDIGQERLDAKIQILKDLSDSDFKFSDFGTRRRFSGKWHEHVVKSFIDNSAANFVGTSNAMLAMKFGVTPIGTMAHEYLQAAQAFAERLEDSQVFALENWLDEYRNNPKLLVALTDVIGVDAFIKDFNYDLASKYSGVRHDSGDPIIFGEKIIKHYQSLGIDPTTKSITFSNSLTIDSAIDLYKHFKGRIKTVYGIGTSLTNDLGLEPLNIVMKMTRCKGRPVAKLSDDPGKTMCEDQAFVNRLKKAFSLK